ncbi:MAG TPA: hypothetical protein PKL56_01880 [Cyclobacteriaceae bacterium]|nr:hypothetical protein [Cyclobacteriaceae bacterium]HMV10952.1 hypothetical protein [Cyclobacteriaceae bacterium]HMV89136.1 hypothetical protein [Cyclobacteriaceae bacterium]HMX00029.1 hypothetical protein [Cyclobacteriaceae bacterium]HMX49109.1 hypothetical protein [Cyclobacteriaceae bacterium]
MYLLLFPLFGAVAYDRIVKLRHSIKKKNAEEIRRNSVALALIFVVAFILVMLTEGRHD